ncbi:hypothetical protein Nmel_003364 [Mimus melanotis]
MRCIRTAAGVRGDHSTARGGGAYGALRPAQLRLGRAGHAVGAGRATRPPLRQHLLPQRRPARALRRQRRPLPVPDRHGDLRAGPGGERGGGGRRRCAGTVAVDSDPTKGAPGSARVTRACAPSQRHGIAGAGRDLWGSFSSTPATAGSPRAGGTGTFPSRALQRGTLHGVPGQLFQCPATLSVKYFLVSVLVCGCSICSMNVASFVSLEDDY